MFVIGLISHSNKYYILIFREPFVLHFISRDHSPSASRPEKLTKIKLDKVGGRFEHCSLQEGIFDNYLQQITKQEVCRPDL